MNEYCDKVDCPAEARVRVDTVNGPLFFCGHHGRTVAPDLFGFAMTPVGSAL